MDETGVERLQKGVDPALKIYAGSYPHISQTPHTLLFLGLAQITELVKVQEEPLQSGKLTVG